MYKVTIKTKYNVIILNVEDAYNDSMKELYEQPYVLEVLINDMNYNIEKSKQLIRKINSIN